MQAGGQGEALRRLADRLCAEFAGPPSTEPPGSPSDFAEEGGLTGHLSDADEELVVRLREALAGVAAKLGGRSARPPTRLVETALDGAEFVIRGELEVGNAEHVIDLMPSFVFLVALSVTNHDRALKASHRTAELAEETRH